MCIRLSWKDENDDGIIDGTTVHEGDLAVSKDGVVLPRPTLDLAGYATGGLVGMNAPAAEGVRVEATRPTQNRFNIGLFNDPAALQRWAESQEGETVILDVLRRNRHEFQA